jgi:hypothetical protein
MSFIRTGILASVVAALLAIAPIRVEQVAAQETAAPGTILLSVFMRHDQSKTRDEIIQELQRRDFFHKFPPQGIEVVSWYVMMGLGNVVTLRVPAERLREVNVSIEQYAWGPFRTEVYATYDFKPIADAERRK